MQCLMEREWKISGFIYQAQAVNDRKYFTEDMPSKVFKNYLSNHLRCRKARAMPKETGGELDEFYRWMVSQDSPLAIVYFHNNITDFFNRVKQIFTVLRMNMIPLSIPALQMSHRIFRRTGHTPKIWLQVLSSAQHLHQCNYTWTRTKYKTSNRRIQW